MKKLWISLTRKDQLKIGITFLVVLILLAISFIPIPEKIYVGTNYLVPTSESSGIGTVYPFYTPAYRLEFTVTSALERAAIEEQYYTPVTQIHKRLDRHHLYFNDDAVGASSGFVSSVGLLNAAYGDLEGIPFDQLLWDYLQTGIELTQLTDGAFHLAIGELSDFWNEVIIGPSLTDESLDPLNNLERLQLLETLVACIPDPDVLESLFIYDEINERIIFQPYYSNELGRYCTSEEFSLSFGGLGKGIANDVLQGLLTAQELTHGLIYGGGSSITTLYNRSFWNPWKIGMNYPYSYGEDYTDERVATLVSQKAFSISQSGGYEGGFVDHFNIDTQEWERIWRHHIIDPISGYPINEFHAILVYTEESLQSALLDALSTALMNMSIADGMDLLSQTPAPIEVMYVKQTSRSTATVSATSGLVDQLELGPGVTLIEIL